VHGWLPNVRRTSPPVVVACWRQAFAVLTSEINLAGDGGWLEPWTASLLRGRGTARAPPRARVGGVGHRARCVVKPPLETTLAPYGDVGSSSAHKSAVGAGEQRVDTSFAGSCRRPSHDQQVPRARGRDVDHALASASR